MNSFFTHQEAAAAFKQALIVKPNDVRANLGTSLSNIRTTPYEDCHSSRTLLNALSGLLRTFQYLLEWRSFRDRVAAAIPVLEEVYQIALPMVEAYNVSHRDFRFRRGISK